MFLWKSLRFPPGLRISLYAFNPPYTCEAGEEQSYSEIWDIALFRQYSIQTLYHYLLPSIPHIRVKPASRSVRHLLPETDLSFHSEGFLPCLMCVVPCLAQCSVDP